MRHKHSVTENPGQLAGIAALSAAIGAVVAMIFTPRSGRQVRSGIKRRADHFKNELQNRSDDVSDEAAEALQKNKSRLQSTAEKVAEDTKSTIKKVQSDAQAAKSDAGEVGKKAQK